jgi:hypothetical protein
MTPRDPSARRTSPPLGLRRGGSGSVRTRAVQPRFSVAIAQQRGARARARAEQAAAARTRDTRTRPRVIGVPRPICCAGGRRRAVAQSTRRGRSCASWVRPRDAAAALQQRCAAGNGARCIANAARAGSARARVRTYRLRHRLLRVHVQDEVHRAGAHEAAHGCGGKRTVGPKRRGAARRSGTATRRARSCPYRTERQRRAQQCCRPGQRWV